MDCTMPLETVIEGCLKKGIDCVAIADHGTTEGGLRLKEIAPFKVIVAEEILTPDGEIIGMFLKETIPSGLSVAQVIARIKAQDALVYIPHPFDTLTRFGLGAEIMEAMISQIDIIEAFNARSPLAQPSNRAGAFADKHGLAKGAGSDAHSPGEIGNAYVTMPDFQGKDDFLPALAQGAIYGRRAHPMVHFYSAWSRLKSIFS